MGNIGSHLDLTSGWQGTSTDTSWRRDPRMPPHPRVDRLSQRRHRSRRGSLVENDEGRNCVRVTYPRVCVTKLIFAPARKEAFPTGVSTHKRGAPLLPVSARPATHAACSFALRA